jgi:hypothetical protein
MHTLTRPLQVEADAASRRVATSAWLSKVYAVRTMDQRCAVSRIATKVSSLVIFARCMVGRQFVRGPVAIELKKIRVPSFVLDMPRKPLQKTRANQRICRCVVWWVVFTPCGTLNMTRV